MSLPHSRAQMVYKKKHISTLFIKHKWKTLGKDTGKGSTPDLDGDFDRRHDEMGAVLSPGVDQPATQQLQSIREQHLLAVIQT